MAAVIEFYQILNEIRAATDTVGSQNPPDGTSTDPGLGSLANRAFQRVYDKIVEATPQDWLFKQATITTVAGQQDYYLPTLIPDIYRARYLDFIVNQTNQSKINLLPYTVDERNNWLFGQPNLIQGGLQLLVSYAPVPPLLQEYATLSVYSQDQIDGLLFTAAAPGLVGLKVSVQIVLAGSAPPAVAVTRNPGNLAVTITIQTTGDTIQNILNAFAANVPVSSVVGVQSITGINSDSVLTAFPATNLGGTVSFDFVSASWADYMIADGSAKLLGRLDLDATFQIQEREASMANVSAMSAVRDSGHSDSLRDEEMEASGGYPFASPVMRTVMYRFAGPNLTLRAIWPGATAY